MARCKKCGARIRFIKTTAGNFMPVDVSMIPVTIGTGKDRIVMANGRVVLGSYRWREEGADGIGFVPHWATCGKGAESIWHGHKINKFLAR